MDQSPGMRQERMLMVEEQIASRGISNPNVLEAMREIPRHIFVLSEYQSMAYRDTPLPIGFGQTISQPYIVAYMTAALHLSQGGCVLEIGTGSGYQAAILARLARFVYSIERIAPLAERAKDNLKSLGYDNIEIIVGDGSLGLPEHAPYDGIIVTAAPPNIPSPLMQQLQNEAHLIAPVGPSYHQDLMRVQRLGNEFRQERLVPVAFVPLIGQYGWRENADYEETAG